MTKEEAIEILQGAIKKPNTKDGYLGQAINMAIKALEVLVENDPLRPKMEGAKVTLEECLEIIDKADAEAEDGKEKI